MSPKARNRTEAAGSFKTPSVRAAASSRASETRRGSEALSTATGTRQR